MTQEHPHGWLGIASLTCPSAHLIGQFTKTRLPHFLVSTRGTGFGLRVRTGLQGRFGFLFKFLFLLGKGRGRERERGRGATERRGEKETDKTDM